MDPKRFSDVHEDSAEKFLNALAENYLLQDAILNATDLAFISTHPDGTISSINKAAEPMLGYSSLDLIGKEKLSVFHLASEIQEYKQELLQFDIEPSTPDEVLLAKAKLKIPDHREWTFVRRDGTHFPASLSLTGIWNERNELIGFLAIASDVTEQRRVESARAESERKFKLMAENIQGTVYLCRNDDTYSMLYLNDQIEKLTGYSAEDFYSGKVSFMELYHSADRELIFEKIDKAVQHHEAFHLQYRFRHRSGEWKWMDEVGIGIYHGNELQMRQGYLIDITERKNDEEELRLSKLNLEIAARELRTQNHQLHEFAHIISHNLRSPVGNIGALVSLLNEKSSLHEYQTIFEKLRTASSNLSETLNDLMEILKIKDESKTKRVRLVFEDVFKKIKEGFAGEIIKANASIDYDFSVCPEIRYSKTYLESIFLNLMSNAIKYRDSSRVLKVHFETSLEDGKVILRVSDNAQGIDLVRHGGKLFNLRKTFHKHKDARGVGLFLTRTQIEAMGGTISAESEPGVGTVFIVRFG
jgi:PAS domain S-box-containing protein